MSGSLSSWFKSVCARRQSRHYRPKARLPRLLGLECLEDRTLLSGDTLQTASFLPFTAFGTGHAASFLARPDEVDLYKVQLSAGDRISSAVSAQATGSGLQSLLRVFDASGAPLALDDQEGGDPRLTFQASRTGDFFVGVSATGDDAYDPTRSSSGHGGATTGLYALDVRLTPATSSTPLLADLTGSSFRMSADTALPGDSLFVNFTVENRGAADPGKFRVELLLADNNRFDSATPVAQTLERKDLTVDPTGRRFSSPAGFQVTLPASLPSGLFFVGLRIVPDPSVPDASSADKSGIHRGQDFELLTSATRAPPGVTDLSQVDAALRTGTDGMLATAVQTDRFSFTVTSALGNGRLTAKVVATSGTLVPRLTLAGPNAQMLIQSDSGLIVQLLLPGTYSLTVSAQSGRGGYRFSTDFVGASLPFAPLAVGSVTKSVVAADVNGDGYPDLVVANSGGGTVGVLLGIGDGSLQAQKTFAAGNDGALVAVGDVNGDSRTDVVTATGFGDGRMNVLLGNGDDSFRTPQTIAVGIYATSVALADVNGDGRPDLATTSSVGTVSVLLGNGDGSFQARKTFATGALTYSLVVADVNGDGRPDLVTANSGDDSVSVLLGIGNGSFLAQQTFAVGHNPHSVAVADVNGDGQPDLVVANSGDDSVSVILGNGDGSFQPRQTFTVGNNPFSVSLADINSDGWLDLVTLNHDHSRVSVLLGNGNGFVQAPPAVSFGAPQSSVAVTDLNGDGRPDLTAVSSYPGSARVLLGNGDGSFQTQPDLAVGANPYSVAVADINGDGRTDVVTANANAKSLSVLLGNGTGSFETSQTIVDVFPFSVVVADINGDGRHDLVTANTISRSVSVLLGNGDGSFQTPQTFALGVFPLFVAVADVNGDGRPDLVTANRDDDSKNQLFPYGDGSVSVLLGNGDGSFQTRSDFDLPSTPYAVTVADVNGDGRPDLVTANRANFNVSVLLGNGDGSFQRPQSFVFRGRPYSVAVADINGDGRPDLVAANHDDRSVSVLLGNGDGSFQTQSDFAVGVGTYSVAVADVNGDGRPDLVAANFDANSVSVLLGNGDGSFQTAQTFAVGIHPVWVIVADVNGDGRADLATANRDSKSVSVLLGNGEGAFAASRPLGGVTVRNTPYLVDLSGHRDGTVDSVILDRSGNILFRRGGPGAGNPFAPAATLNPGRPVRDLTIVKTGAAFAIAAVDSNFDRTLSSANHFVYAVSLFTVAVNGSVTRQTAFSTTLLPARIAAADLTGNGLDDLVVANSLDNSVTIAMQTAPGVFDPNTLTLPVGVAPSDIALVDVNGDHLLDIVVTDQVSGDVTVLVNDSTHSFQQSERFRAGGGLFGIDTSSGTTEINSPNQSVSLAAGDFTGNGRNDLVVVNRGARSLSLLVNDGNSGFSTPQPDLTTSTRDGLSINYQAGPVVAGHFHGQDKPLDLAILMEDSAQVWIFSGDGHGHFTFDRHPIDAGTLPTGLTLVAGSTPGVFDLLVGNQFGDILRLVGTGDGTFAPPPPFTGDHAPLDVQFLKGDHTPYILVANQKANTLSVQTPAANGTTFAPIQTLAVDQNSHLAPGDVRWAKLDRPNGQFDAVVIASGSNSVLVYHTVAVDPVTGKPLFDPPTAYSVGSEPDGVTIKDINGDGIPDMLIANHGSNDVSVLFGAHDAAGNWIGTAGPRLNSGGTGPVATTLRDMNSDGIPDLVVTNSDGKIAVLPGVGQGFFNDVNPRIALDVPVGLGAPSFSGTSGVGFATTENGDIVRIDLNNLTASVVFQPGPGLAVRALAALADGAVIAAFDNGHVAELLADASGQLSSKQDFVSLSGELTEPSALQTFDSGTGLQVFVTAAGEDRVFVFTPAPPTLPVTIVTQSQEEPLILIVTLLAGSGNPDGQTTNDAARVSGNLSENGSNTTNSIAARAPNGTENDSASGETDEAAFVGTDTTEVPSIEIGIDVDGKLRRLEVVPQAPAGDPDGPSSQREEPQPLPIGELRELVGVEWSRSFLMESPTRPVLTMVEPAVFAAVGPEWSKDLAQLWFPAGLTGERTSARFPTSLDPLPPPTARNAPVVEFQVPKFSAPVGADESIEDPRNVFLRLDRELDCIAFVSLCLLGLRRDPCPYRKRHNGRFTRQFYGADSSAP